MRAIGILAEEMSFEKAIRKAIATIGAAVKAVDGGDFAAASKHVKTVKGLKIGGSHSDRRDCGARRTAAASAIDDASFEAVEPSVARAALHVVTKRLMQLSGYDDR